MLLVTLSGCVPGAESDVVAYVSADQEFSQPILDAFERGRDYETGVIAKFDIESTKTVGLVNDILAAGDPPVCDVFWNNEVLHAIRLQKAGLLQTRRWDVPAGYPADMRAADGSWCGFAARARVLIINTDRMPDPADWPSDVADLADPRYHQRCGMARPLFGTTATHFAVLASRNGIDQTLDQLRSIRDNARIYSGNKQVALAVSSGQIDWGLTDTDDAIIERDADYPVAIVFPDQQSGRPGTMRIPNTAMVLKNAPHPVAAGQLADYLVSPQTEDRLAMGNSSQIPLNRSAKFPPRVMPDYPVRWMRVDFAAAADLWDDWIAKVAPIFETSIGGS